jgi:hypothetical protein
MAGTDDKTAPPESVDFKNFLREFADELSMIQGVFLPNKLANSAGLHQVWTLINNFQQIW